MRETVGSRFESHATFTGFDYLRIGLSSAICLWHSWWIFTGQVPWELGIWKGWLMFIPQSFVPMFFALSGFLVAGSLERNRLHHFLALRVLRIVPALAFEVFVSACVIGVIFTSLPLQQYLLSKEFLIYFLNIVGIIHVTLPHVFMSNPLSGLSNPQLWTIPFELECYGAIAILSVLGLVWKRYYLLLVVSGIIIARTIYIAFIKPEVTSAVTSVGGHFTGRILVIMFLVGVLFYRHRSRIPYSDLLGFGSLISIAVLFRYPALSWIAALPTSYFVVWIGLKRPPAIPFGDLSYGVYLFHFPVSQMILATFGGVTKNWLPFGLASLIGSALFAAISWNFIEKPLLAKKRSILQSIDRNWLRMRKRMVTPRTQ